MLSNTLTQAALCSRASSVVNAKVHLRLVLWLYTCGLSFVSLPTQHCTHTQKCATCFAQNESSVGFEKGHHIVQALFYSWRDEGLYMCASALNTWPPVLLCYLDDKCIQHTRIEFCTKCSLLAPVYQPCRRGMTAFTATSHSFSSSVNCLSSYDCINELACVNVHVPDFSHKF